MRTFHKGNQHIGILLVVQILFEKTGQHVLLIMDSLIEELNQDNKEPHRTDPIPQEQLRRNRKIEVPRVTRVPEEGVHAMGDQLVGRVLLVTNQVGEVATGGKEGAYSKPLADCHEHERWVDQEVGVL